MNVRICDRCGARIDGTNGTVHMSVIRVDEKVYPNEVNEYDLCVKCTEEFNHFMEGEKK